MRATRSFHSAYVSLTVFSFSPMATPSSVISTAGHAVQAGHSVILIGSMFFTSFQKPCYMLNLGLRSRGPEKMLTIGKVARRVGIRPSAIRYYERQEILEPTVRGANGYRSYGDEAVKLLLFVKRAQSLGITLREIKPLLTLATQGQRPCSHVKQIARNHLQEIDGKIRELQALRNQLRTLLKRKARRPH